ncbi:phytoene desaturase [Niallia circulans]|uniref:4,4'-diaponeurosporene oxygenase n=1 Tax=Niallia circulans TaxID=1397 RepID=A0A553SRV5_NIACI|nr:phytoene desaturase family protein [Niallia circulans]TRZ39729.1 phytoene desaturase [Niallia circulans]
MKKKVLIIGGGLAGLSAAITLANKGFQVELFEKNKHFGGKLMPVALGDYTFDFGPNTITMPEVFRKVIEQTGEKAEDYFHMVKLEHHTRNVFSDGTSFDLSSNREYMLQQLMQLDAGHKYDDFLKEITRLYKLSAKHFLPKTFHSWQDYLSPSLGAALMQVRPLQSLDSFFRQYFSHPHVLQAFNRYSTYIGSSPYKTPATFAMIAYLEMIGGVYYVEGGNVKIAEAYAKVAQKLGARLYADATVKRIIVKNKKAIGIELEDGEKIQGDYFIMNADLLKAYPELVNESDRPSFPDSKAAGKTPSTSAFVVLAGVNKRFSELRHHNVYFSNNYKQEFIDLFQHKQYSSEPTIYISNSSYTEPGRSPGGSNLFILANAPALPADGKLQVNPEMYKELIYQKLATFGLSLKENIVEEKVYTPADIASQFGAFRGALYGLSSNRKKDAFLRPKNSSKDIANLFFAGGSTHPGGGSPIVTWSGMNTANLIIKADK